MVTLTSASPWAHLMEYSLLQSSKWCLASELCSLSPARLNGLILRAFQNKCSGSMACIMAIFRAGVLSSQANAVSGCGCVPVACQWTWMLVSYCGSVWNGVRRRVEQDREQEGGSAPELRSIGGGSTSDLLSPLWSWSALQAHLHWLNSVQIWVNTFRKWRHRPIIEQGNSLTRRRLPGLALAECSMYSDGTVALAEDFW